MREDFIPFALPFIDDAEINEVCDTMRSGWLTTGPKTRRFEEAFAEAVGARHALAVNSATAGLHLALEAAGLECGQRVVTTPYTFTASSEVIRYLGADPVFVDIEPDTFNIDVEQVGEALANDPEIVGILPVHFAGQAADMDALMPLGENLPVGIIEDAAHAFPSDYRGRTVGGIGRATVFSFYVTKTLATGEGGMITTDDDEIAARAKVMRLHGISRDAFDRYTSDKPAWYYEVVAPGFKYNLTDIASSIGLHQLAKAESMRQRREQIGALYAEAFADLPIDLPVVAATTTLHSWHLYVIRLQLDALTIDRDEFIKRMADKGIGTSVHFIPLHLQPYWRDRYALTPEHFPRASAVYQRVVSLPIYPGLSDAQCHRIADAVREVVTGALG